MDRRTHYDVVVIGGGAAGVAAAVGAHSRGARTLLVERYGFLGGAAANANVPSYCGFYTPGDAGRPVVGGVGAGVIAELAKLGFEVAPILAPSGNWIILCDPEGVKVAFDRIAAEHAFDCRLHCTLIGAHRSGAAVEAVTLFDHAGRFDVEAAAFVDASGEADLGFAAGVPSMRDLNPQRGRQLASFPVRIGGVSPQVDVRRDVPAEVMAQFRNDDAAGAVLSLGGYFLRLPRSNDLWWRGVDLATDGIDSADLGVAERRARDLSWRFLGLLRTRVPGFENAYIAGTGPRLGIRDSRQLQTRYLLTEDDLLSGRTRDDGIACGSWPAELHSGLEEGPEFRPVGGSGFYHIPLPALRAALVDNLWLGGRVIGCDEQVYGSLRVMGTAFATGQAAGVAAAHCAEGGAPDDAAAVRAELLRQGAILG
ncbi:MAG: FAD-dependent oxidoreductase [Deltaproteobacteria bacterium]|nr:FAD-dependent oxidoreductase [Deltaproteobacteria bacterium]